MNRLQVVGRLLALSIVIAPPLHAEWLPTSGPEGGTIRAMEASGTTLYVGMDNGGVYKSTDYAASWSEANSGLPDNLPIQAIAASGSSIFAGTLNAGVFRSTDSGATWSPVNTGLANLVMP